MARQPVLFLGHGSPMNAIEDNRWSRAFRELGRDLAAAADGVGNPPRAILSISAHWYTNGTWLTGNAQPPTIHDFGGFPPALYEVQYPARGDTKLAARIVTLLGESRAGLNSDWGLDHGTWSVLTHLRAAADLPVIQLSINARLPHAEHVAIGRALAPLRDEGVMILGSGNVTHNLRHALGVMSSGHAVPTPPWAAQFDADVAKALVDHDLAFLAKAAATDAGRISHPSPDHYLPLLYVAGAADASDEVRFPITGFDASSLSMRGVWIGPKSATPT